MTGKGYRPFKRLAAAVGLRAMKYAGIPLRDPLLVRLFGQQTGKSGVDVTEESALNCGAVYSAVSLISSAVAMLPKHVKRRKAKPGDDGIAWDHNVTQLLTNPNPYMTQHVFAETLQAHACTWGNGYALIQRDRSGYPIALWPVNPAAVTVHGAEQEEETYYLLNEGTDSEVEVEYRDMLHIHGLGSDGRQGKSVVGLAREAIGLSLATEGYGAAYFGNGATPRIVIKHPGDLTAKAKDNLRKSWKEIYSNADNPHAVAILDEGMAVDTIGLPPEDSQFLQTRTFQVVEVARWFRVPPHMLYDMNAATFNNTEQQGINFLTYTIGPWLNRWVQELTRKLFNLSDYAEFYIDFDPTPLLKTDTTARFTAYATARNGGWYTLNMINRMEGLPLLPPDVGDTHLAPSTMKVLGTADPTTPIDPQTITTALETVKSVGRAVPSTLAVNMLNAMMPGASRELVSQLVAALETQGVVQSVKA